MAELAETFGAIDLRAGTACNNSTLSKDDAPRITTPPQQWAYAAAFPLRECALEIGDQFMVIRVEATVEAGRIGVAVAEPDMGTFLSEEDVAGPGRAELEVTIRSPKQGAWLVFRNVAEGAASSVRVHAIRTYLADGISRRKTQKRLEVFDSADAIAINRARMQHLTGLNLSIAGKSVLDVGCGVGHLSRFFVERNCPILCVDARLENLDRLQQLYPGTHTHLANVESDSLSELGNFDIVFCYGLIYHCESPMAALRNMASCCRELLLLETVILDHPRPVLELAEESSTINNLAVAGFGCRPSPAFIVNALIGLGFPFVYATKTHPDFPDFHFQSIGNGDWRRDGHLLRRVFIASRSELENPSSSLLLQGRK